MRSCYWRRAVLMWMALVVILAVSGVTAAKTKIVVVVRDGENELPDAVVEQFEARNPDIEVETVKAAYDQFEDKFLAMMAGGLQIDVVTSMSLSSWPFYAQQGLFIDLGPYIRADHSAFLAKGVSPFVLEGLKAQGVTRSIPYSLWASLTTVYNATFFEEAGLPLPKARWDDRDWTWSAMVQAARKLVRYTSDGRLTRAGLWHDVNDITLQGTALMWGGDLFPKEAHETGVARYVTFNTPENRRALTELVKLSSEYKLVHHGVRTANRIQVKDGTAAMGLMAGGSIEQSGWNKAYNWGVAPYPIPDTMSRRVAMPAWVRAAAIHSSSKHPEAAWRFIKFMLLDAYEIGTYTVAGQANTWNFSRGISVGHWQKYAGIICRANQMVQTPMELTAFFAQAIGEYTRIAPSNALVGGELMQGSSAPLKDRIREAMSGTLSVEQALLKAEQEGNSRLNELVQNLNKVR